MKAKLIKTGDDFLLKDVNGETLAITSGTIKGRMLSLKNCQAIERGYDLDELANELLYSKYPFHPSNDSGYWLDMYKEGFQKALELMGDKKFSEEDIRRTIELSRETELKTGGYDPRPFTITKYSKEEIIESLHQTEWDVEIKMVKEHIGSGCYKKYPKLDEDGCLILKPLPKE